MMGVSSFQQPLLLYLHLPKAAGTTLSEWFYGQLVGEREVDKEEDGKLMAGVYYYPAGYVSAVDAQTQAGIDGVLARDDLRAVLGHFHFGLHHRFARPSVYVTVLRDPVDRVISLYRFHQLVQREQGHLEGVTLPESMDLEAFVREPPYAEIDNGQTRRLAGVSPREGRCTQQMLEQARMNLRRHFTVVGTMEQFDETIVLLRRMLHLPATATYFLRNVNTDRKRVPAESEAVRRLIAEHNALDMALYEDAQRLLHEQIARCGTEFQQELAMFKSRQAAVEGDARQHGA